MRKLPSFAQRKQSEWLHALFPATLSNKVCHSFQHRWPFSPTPSDQREEPLAIFSKEEGASCEGQVCFLNFQVGERGGNENLTKGFLARYLFVSDRNPDFLFHVRDFIVCVPVSVFAYMSVPQEGSG